MPFKHLLIAGKKSTVCVERTGEVAGISERSPGEETGYCYTEVHASIGYSADQSTSSEDPDG